MLVVFLLVFWSLFSGPLFMEMKQREREGVIVEHKAQVGNGTRRSVAGILRVGVCCPSITSPLGSKATSNAREHLRSLIWQQRNLNISSHPSHSAKGAEVPVLKAAPIILCTFKAPVTKAIWVYHYLHGMGVSSHGQGTGLPPCQPQRELCLAFLRA